MSSHKPTVFKATHIPATDVFWVSVRFEGGTAAEQMCRSRYSAFCRALDVELLVAELRIPLTRPLTPFPIRTIRSLKEYFRGLL